MPRTIKITYRKLGKEQAVGIATSKAFAQVNGRIELDERLKGGKLFAALLHEVLHHSLPTTHEDEILRIEKEVAPILWRELKKNPEKFGV